MIKLDRAVIVEGKYDKIRLSSIVDGLVLTTDGFGIFKNKEKLALIKAVAEKTGVIILTDSDSAGMVIRNRLKGFIGDEHITNVYLPPIKGKEKRKDAPSAEGILGVEGTPDEIIADALKRFCTDSNCKTDKLTKMDFYEMGLSGTDGSSILRDRVKEKLGFPSALTANGLIEAVNVLYSPEEFKKTVDEVKLWEEQQDRK